MKTINWFLLIVIIVVIIIASFLLVNQPEETIKIGFIGPLTGDAAVYGVPIKDAVSLAAEEINSNGGINGKKVELIYEDGFCDGKNAVTAAQKLISVDNVKIIIGGMCSSETLGVAPIAEKEKVILFSTGSGSPDITNAGDYVFRNLPSDASSGRKMAELAIKEGLTKVAVLAENTDYAQALRKVFVSRFKELKGEIVADEAFASEDIDIRSQITKIKAANPFAIYLVPQTPAKAELALKELKEFGINIQILSNEVSASEAVLSKVGNAVEGMFYAEPFFNPDDLITRRFLDKYSERYGSIDVGPPYVYLANAYDALYIFKEVIEKYGEDVESIKEGLYQIKDRKGAAGSLTIDENGDPVLEYVIKTIREGKSVDY